MTFFEYLVILRRRWAFVVIGALAGLVGGVVTAPGSGQGPPTYEATVTLLVEPTSSTGASLNLEQTALLVTAGEVPDAVAQRLQEAGLPQRYRLKPIADLDVAAISIRVTSRSRELVTVAADFAAEELVRKLQAKDVALYQAATTTVQDRVTIFESQIEELNATLVQMAPDDIRRSTIETERDSTAILRQQARDELRALEDAGLPTPPLTALDEAEAERVEKVGYQLPASHAARGAILGVFGLLLGLGGALTADRLDTRIRGKDDAERAFGLPVIAEIPPLPGGTGKTELLVTTHPAAPVVEAFRALRTVLTFAASARHESGNGNENGDGHGHGASPCEVVLITSPMASEGKTTTAAHLAGVLAEAGKRVLVISADFRRPKIHEFFNVEREPGLADVLGTGDGQRQLADLQLSTNIEGVKLLPSGKPVKNPAELLRDTVHLVRVARQLFDYIIIDSAPLLVANDATELAAAADVVILLARADRTSRAAAQRATEVLRRVDAPLLGAVVVAAYDTPTAYGYYRYRYYAGGKEPATSSAKERMDPLDSHGSDDLVDVPVREG